MQFTPVAHGIQNRDQGFSTFGQAVFDFWRDLRVLFPVNEAVCLEFF